MCMYQSTVIVFFAMLIKHAYLVSGREKRSDNGLFLVLEHCDETSEHISNKFGWMTKVPRPRCFKTQHLPSDYIFVIFVCPNSLFPDKMGASDKLAPFSISLLWRRLLLRPGHLMGVPVAGLGGYQVGGKDR